MTGLAFPKPEPRARERKRVPRSNAGGRLISKAERACSKLAKKRAGGVCEISGKRGTETAHGFSKGSCPSVRFDGRNLFWVTHEVHMRGHEEPEWWRGWMLRLLGIEEYHSLLLRSVFGDMDDPREVLAAASAGRFLIERKAA